MQKGSMKHAEGVCGWLASKLERGRKKKKGGKEDSRTKWKLIVITSKAAKVCGRRGFRARTTEEENGAQ